MDRAYHFTPAAIPGEKSSLNASSKAAGAVGCTGSLKTLNRAFRGIHKRLPVCLLFVNERRS